MFKFIQTHYLWFILGAFILGVVGTGVAGYVWTNGRIGQLDIELAAGRATIDRLTTIGNELTDENQYLTKLSADQLRGIAEAIAIVSGQQSATGDIVTKLRNVIETLQKVRSKLASIANIK